MERRISVEPRTFLVLGVVLLVIYVVSLISPNPPMLIVSPVIIITVVLVVFQRYFSDIKLENVRMRQVSELIFYAALAAILVAYTIFIIMESDLGEFLFALGIILFCIYVSLPGLIEKLAKNQKS